MELTQQIKNKAIELGFDLAGVTNASPIDAEQVRFLSNWLSCGLAAQMQYMHRNFQKRINPANLLKDAKSVIVVGLNFKPPKPTGLKTKAPAGRIAGYAQFEDYHLFIKKTLRELADFITLLVDNRPHFKICVDSTPLAERALAVRAGLGFIGKNHMLINPELGPQLFLGEIITDIELKPDKPLPNGCRNCDKCLKACPAGAFRPDGQFDAGKCINYLTIEHKGSIPSELAEKIADRLFGCEDCILACPYQKSAPVCKNSQFRFYNDRAKLNLHDVLAMNRQQFDKEFADSVLKRLGLERLKRNAGICLENIAAGKPKNQGAKNASTSHFGTSTPL